MAAEASLSGGGCYCGAVRYEVSGPLRGVVNCHCSECQKLNGSVGAHSKAPTARLRLLRDDGLRWFEINRNTRRAFCGQCGSPLFWEARGQPATGIVAGSLDDPSGLELLGHIFVGEKPVYNVIADELPRFEASSDGAFPGDQL